MAKSYTQLEYRRECEKEKNVEGNKNNEWKTTSVFDVNRIWMSFFLLLAFACSPAATLRVKLHSFHVVENMLQKGKNVRYVSFYALTLPLA